MQKQKVRWLRWFLYLASFTPFILLTYRLFLWGPPVWPDEAILTDASLTLIKTGHIATNIFRGAVPGAQTHFYFYPPFYFFALAQWIRVFGASIESVRAMSVLVGAGTLIIFGLLVRRVYRSHILTAAGIFFLGIDPSFGVASRTARMDIVVFFLLILMVFTMVIAREKEGLGWYVGAGIVAALAVMTHPAGLVALAVGIIFLFVDADPRKIPLRRILALLVPSIITFGGWIISMGTGVSSLIEQYQLQFMLKASQLSNLVDAFHEDRLWQILAVIIVALLIAQFGAIIQRRKTLDIVWLAGFILGIALMYVGKEFWFLLYLEPFFILILITLLARLHGYSPVGKVTILILFSSALAVTMLLTWESWTSFMGFSKPYYEVTRNVASFIPNGSHVLLAAIPDPYFDLRKNMTLTLFEDPPTPTKEIALRELLDNTDIIVATSTPNSWFRSYIERNTTRMQKIQSGTANTMLVVTLVGRGSRR